MTTKLAVFVVVCKGSKYLSELQKHPLSKKLYCYS